MKTLKDIALEREKKRNKKRKRMSSPETREKQQISSQRYIKKLKIQQNREKEEKVYSKIK